MYQYKGYPVPEGFMGYVDGAYRLFASEQDYKEWYDDDERIFLEAEAEWFDAYGFQEESGE